jgi:hypothetical protein
MKQSTDRILTAHAGGLPGPPGVMTTVRAIQFRGPTTGRHSTGG